MTVRSWIGIWMTIGLVVSGHGQAADEPDNRSMAVDVQWRLRVESWNNVSFGASNDGTFVLNRLLAGFNAKVDAHTRVYLQGEIAVSTERDLPGGRRTLDAEELDLQQGYVEWTGAQKTQVRVGRHALKFGSQRLISPLAWSNTQRSWDGVVAKIQIADAWEATGFWTQYAPVQKFHFNDPDAQMPLWGVYLKQKQAEGQLGHDLYWFGSESAAKTFNGTTGPQRRHTLGGRMHGPIAGTAFDMDLEAALQTGHVGPADVNAHMLAAQLGYRPAGASGTRYWVGVDYASGDSSPGGDVETFDHLFPLGHAYLGQIDVVGRQNVIDLNGGVSAKIAEDWSFSLAGHYFHRADPSDALYNAGGGIVRAGGLGSSREIGAEIDLIVNHRIDSSASCQFGYGHFFAGDFISQSGSSSDIDFVYLSYLLAF